MRRVAVLAAFSGWVALAVSFPVPVFADAGYDPYYTRGNLQFQQSGQQPVLPAPVTDGPQRAQTPEWQYPSATQDYHLAAVQAPPPAPPKPLPTTNGDDLATRGGMEFGLQLSNYHYQEHLVPDQTFMSESGIKYGLTFDGTATLSHEFFVTGDIRFTYGKNDYTSDGTGTIRNTVPDFIGEGRVVLGRDYSFGVLDTRAPRFDLSPYLGVGFRDLYNDMTSLGSGGYARNSEYFYMPFGSTGRFHAGPNARISVNAEYDWLILGRQTSYLNDVSSLDPTIENDQNNGYGLRASVMYERADWSIGPFVQYWNVNNSQPTYYIGYCPSLAQCVGYEPHNQTLEYGLQARYHL